MWSKTDKITAVCKLLTLLKINTLNKVFKSVTFQKEMNLWYEKCIIKNKKTNLLAFVKVSRRWNRRQIKEKAGVW